jgi:hypothetical protein
MMWKEVDVANIFQGCGVATKLRLNLYLPGSPLSIREKGVIFYKFVTNIWFISFYLNFEIRGRVCGLPPCRLPLWRILKYRPIYVCRYDGNKYN